MNVDIAHSGPAPTLQRRTPAASSLLLAAIAFVMVTGETAPVGLIGDVAQGVHTTQSRVGLTVSWYALIAGATAVPLTRLSARFDRRRVLLACAVTFSAGHLATALAVDIGTLLFGRGLAAVGHGLFFAVATPAAVRLAAPQAKGRAGSRVAVGAASALVLGTPLATVSGQVAGWRAAMFLVAGASLALSVLVWWVFPPLPPLHADQPRSAGIGAVLRSRTLLVVLAVTLAVVAAHFTLFTYVAPYTGEHLGVRGTAFSVVLLAFGVAAVLGSALGGRLADLRPVAGARLAAVAFVAAPAGVWLAARSGATAMGVPLLVLWGGAFAVLAVSTALAVLRRVRGPQAETATALHGITFQVGIVAGSAFGAHWHAAGLLSAVPLVTATGGVLVFALLARGDRAFGRSAAG